MLHSHDHDQLYKHICPTIQTHMHAHLYAEHNNDTIKTSDTVLRKIYLSLYSKGLCVIGSWRLNRTATYWPPLYWPWSKDHTNFFFFLNYFQFHPSRKALVIKTNAFTIIINLNSFFMNPNINRQQRDKLFERAIYLQTLKCFLYFFLFSFFSSFHPACCSFFLCSFSFFLFLVVGMFFFLFFFTGIFLNFPLLASQVPHSFCLWPLHGSST